MKKRLVKSIMTVLCISLVIGAVGCGSGSKKDKVTEKETASSSDTKKEDNKKTDNEDSKGTVAKSDLVKGTVEKPIKMNEAGALAATTSKDSKTEFMVQMKVIKVTRGTDAKKMVDEYDATDPVTRFKALEEGFEFVVLDTEIAVPKNVTSNPEDLIMEGSNFSVKGKDGAAVKKGNSALIGIPTITIKKSATGFMKQGETRTYQIATILPTETKEFLFETRSVKAENMSYFLIK
ncbi:hypothetical protein SAMN02745163_02011 [Clostridium cavendishii DSM 21758]|uniref:Lipoprotein n=1 Tax=Clostridium cavendishii DSM 21758 TaxID=1121302 RepID=A0A1M6JEY6_9CLOT|nr:hypothetical protein [Clostridium cavendishii]SHJ45241.1 hypothetical protein SAMN02745163_02011 [Clostridium cavendishii DSM 21758]